MLALLEIAVPALYAVAILVLTAYGGNLLWLSLVQLSHEGLRARRPSPMDEPPSPDESWPVVTVQLPLYNEAEVAARLIDACAAFDYPRSRLEIQVLDDSTDETSECVARRVEHWQEKGLNIVHIQRADRTGYKAGALANGLQSASGDLVAIFDADFVPTPDFLRRTVPRFFENENLGLVQARWGHLNRDDSLLTMVQAFGLDAHFALEQRVREMAGCFMNFNGTAGVWRRACIEDAGGWSHDTLTEDLDLSYRAQLCGWDFTNASAVEAPAELPPDMNALRSQQFRWAKGGAETAIKLLGPLWRSAEPLRVRIEGTFHLCAHFAFPFILLAALTHVPLLVLKAFGYGPGSLYFGLMAVGLLGFVGFFLSHLLAQRYLHADWPTRMKLFPVFLAGTMGLSLSNTNAVWQALRGTDTAFIRTPKFGSEAEGWWQSRYAVSELPRVAWGEIGLAVYSTVGLGVTIALGEWAAVSFQALFALGFLLVGASAVRQVVAVRRDQPALASASSAAS